jgi:hypothetical protein
MLTISLKQTTGQAWAIQRCRTNLFSDLTLEAAISLAREIARDEHQRMGYGVSVEMPGPTCSILLAHYAKATESAAAMAA